MKKQRLIGWLTVQLRNKQKTCMFFTLTRNHKLVWKRVFETSFCFCYSLFNASLFSLCFAKQNKSSAPKLPWMNGIEYSISVNDRWHNMTYLLNSNYMYNRYKINRKQLSRIDNFTQTYSCNTTRHGLFMQVTACSKQDQFKFY